MKWWTAPSTMKSAFSRQSHADADDVETYPETSHVVYCVLKGPSRYTARTANGKFTRVDKMVIWKNRSLRLIFGAKIKYHVHNLKKREKLHLKRLLILTTNDFAFEFLVKA